MTRERSKPPSIESPRVLLSFTGFHDPFSDTSVKGERETGPVLTVVSEIGFDQVFLFTTPNTREISEATQSELRERHTGIRVEIVELPLSDPTNYLGILNQLRTHFRRIDRKLNGADYSICVSSGTPHMHASWVMLAASGEIPATILQTRALRFVKEGKGQVSEIDISNSAFPRIQPFGELPEEDDDERFQGACADSGIVGQDENYVAELRKAFVFAQYDSPILIIGETGVGKELVADLIHRASKRGSKRKVSLNCAALSDTLIDSQLFGHKKGAFTGAAEPHAGFFETAMGGSLFLDELGEMPMASQPKLLRAIQDGVIQKLGESKETKVDVRVIAATNRDIRTAIAEKRLREDLYYRFDAKIEIPPLRQRRSDIPRLAAHFLDQWNRKHEKQTRLTHDAIRALTGRSWPGNVRELRGVITQSAQLCPGKTIKANDLVFDQALGEPAAAAVPEPYEGFNLKGYLEDTREQLLERAMELADGNKTKAADLLGVTPQAVSQWVRGRD